MPVPAPYNLTAGFGNTTGIIGLMQSVNDNLMGGSFGILLLASLFVISYIGFTHSTDQKTAFASSSFLMFLFSLMLRALTLIADWAVYGCIGLLAISIAASWKK